MSKETALSSLPGKGDICMGRGETWKPARAASAAGP